METRIALIGIIVEDLKASDALNKTLHDFAPYIVGRMGVPYPKKEVSIISVIIDAPADVISSLSGKLGMIKGLNVKVQYSKNRLSTKIYLIYKLKSKFCLFSIIVYKSPCIVWNKIQIIWGYFYVQTSPFNLGTTPSPSVRFHF